MLVPCYKRARPAVRGRVDPTRYDAEVWALGEPGAEEPPGGRAEADGRAGEAGPVAEEPREGPSAAAGAAIGRPPMPGDGGRVAPPETGAPSDGGLGPSLGPVRARGRRGR